MPATAPGTLTPEQTADIMAFVLASNGDELSGRTVTWTSDRITSYNVCYTKLLRTRFEAVTAAPSGFTIGGQFTFRRVTV